LCRKTNDLSGNANIADRVLYKPKPVSVKCYRRHHKKLFSDEIVEIVSYKSMKRIFSYKLYIHFRQKTVFVSPEQCWSIQVYIIRWQLYVCIYFLF
jgi:hypothetical protein